MYAKVSIPKNGDGAGCAVIKDENIILIDVEDIVAEPTRSIGNVQTEGDYTLKYYSRLLYRPSYARKTL